MSSQRQATHSGSWYTNDGNQLDGQLTRFLASVEHDQSFDPPIVGCKAVIAPHAGYSYSGPAAGWAYKSIDTSGIKRVFILGPSHHVYLNGCALSSCEEYNTPIGALPLDLDTIAELRATGQFEDMSLQTDEGEHSIEMHLPYIRKIFEALDVRIVPILVGAIDYDTEVSYGQLLAPYLSSPDTFFVVSSDFCHWGTRFSYTSYYPEPPPSDTPSVKLSRTSTPKASHPIHASIRALDHEGMDALKLPGISDTAAEAHKAFATYLTRTKNTICGRHPIGVLMSTLAELEKGGNIQPCLQWVRYEQSSACETIADSSVSYASAFVKF